MNEGREKAILTVPLPKLLLPNFCAGAGLPNFELWQYHCQNRRKEGKNFWIVAIKVPKLERRRKKILLYFGEIGGKRKKLFAM